MLKELYDNLEPRLKNKFKKLKEYVENSEEIEKKPEFNYSYNSLKWLIHSLAPSMKDAMGEILAKTIEQADSFEQLNSNVKSLPIAKEYDKLLNPVRPHPLTIGVIRNVNGVKVFLNDTTHNCNSTVFNKRFASIVIFSNPLTRGKGILIDRNQDDINLVDVDGLWYYLDQKEPNTWFKVGDNFIVSGGKRNKTYSKMQLDEILEALKFYVTPKKQEV